MEDLFFNLQREVKIKRQINLLRYLSNYTEPVFLKNISEHLNCTMPTLLSDIDILNNILKKNIKIKIIEKQKAITNISSSYISVDSIITILIKETLVYQIVECCLYKKEYTIIKASYEFSASRSTLLRTLKHMNQILKAFHIQISTENFTFIGKEEDIRVFLFHFFKCFSDREILSTESSLYAKHFSELMEKLEGDRLHFCHFRLSLWTSIARIRWQKKCYVTLSNQLEDEILNQKNLNEFKIILNSFSFLDGVTNLPDNEMLWAYISCLHCIAYTDVLSYQGSQRKLVYCREEKPRVIFQIEQLFLKIGFPKEIFLSRKLEMFKSYLVNLRLLRKISLNFEIVSENLKDLIWNMHGDLCEKWSDHLNCIPLHSDLSVMNLEDVVTSCAIFHLAIFEEKKKNLPVHVLFAFQGDPGFDHYLVQTSNLLVEDHVQVDYFLEEQLDQQVIQQIKPDLVICNYDLNVKKEGDYEVVRLSNIPTLIDWGVARTAIERLSQKYF